MERLRVENMVLWSEARKLLDAFDKMPREGGFIVFAAERADGQYRLDEGVILEGGEFQEALLGSFCVLGLYPEPNDPSTQWPGPLIHRRERHDESNPVTRAVNAHYERVGPPDPAPGLGSIYAYMVPRE